jgi:hypothetical protein
MELAGEIASKMLLTTDSELMSNIVTAQGATAPHRSRPAGGQQAAPPPPRLPWESRSRRDPLAALRFPEYQFLESLVRP